MAAPMARGDSDGTDHVPAGLNVPSTAEQAPVWGEPVAASGPAPAFWLLGAHGGAGVSTMARSWAPAADSRRGWPAADRYPYVVIVARTHRAGLAAAHVLLRQSAARLVGGCVLLGLLTIADHTGTLPATLRRHRDLVEELAPAAWRLPFLPLYRQITAEQMPRWSPRDPPVSRARFSRSTGEPAMPAEFADTGAAIFHAAQLLAHPL